MADEWKTLLAKSQRDIEKILEPTDAYERGMNSAAKLFETRKSLAEAQYKRSPEYLSFLGKLAEAQAGPAHEMKMQQIEARGKMEKDVAQFRNSLVKAGAKAGLNKQSLDLLTSRFSHPDPDIQRYGRDKFGSLILENNGLIPSGFDMKRFGSDAEREFLTAYGEKVPEKLTQARVKPTAPNPTVSESVMQYGPGVLKKGLETVTGLGGMALGAVGHGLNVAGLGVPGRLYEAATGEDTSFSSATESGQALGQTAFDLVKGVAYGIPKGFLELLTAGMLTPIAGAMQGYSGDYNQGPGWFPEIIEAAVNETMKYLGEGYTKEEIRSVIEDDDFQAYFYGGLADLWEKSTGSSRDEAMNAIAEMFGEQPDPVGMLLDLIMGLAAAKAKFSGRAAGAVDEVAAAVPGGKPAVPGVMDDATEAAFANAGARAGTGGVPLSSERLLSRMMGEEPPANWRSDVATSKSAEELLNTVMGGEQPARIERPVAGAPSSIPVDDPRLLTGIGDARLANDAAKAFEEAVTEAGAARVAEGFDVDGPGPRSRDVPPIRERTPVDDSFDVGYDMPGGPGAAIARAIDEGFSEIEPEVISAKDFNEANRIEPMPGEIDLGAVGKQSRPLVETEKPLVLKSDAEVARAADEGVDGAVREQERRIYSKEIEAGAVSDPEAFYRAMEEDTAVATAALDMEADKVMRVAARGSIGDIEMQAADAAVKKMEQGAGLTGPQTIYSLGPLDSIKHAVQIADRTPYAGEFRQLSTDFVESSNAAIDMFSRYKKVGKKFGITDAESVRVQEYAQKFTNYTKGDPLTAMRDRMIANGDTKLWNYYAEMKSLFDEMAEYLPEDKRRRVYWPQRPPDPPPIAGIDIPRNAFQGLLSDVHKDTYRARKQTGPGKAAPADYWMYDSIREFYLHRGAEVGGPVPKAKALIKKIAESDILDDSLKADLTNSLREAIGQRIGSSSSGNLQFELAQQLTKIQKGTSHAAEIARYREKYRAAIKSLNQFMTGPGGAPVDLSKADAAFKKKLAAKRAAVENASTKLTELTDGTAHRFLFDVFGRDPLRAVVGSAVGSFVTSILGFAPFAHMAMNSVDLNTVGPMLAGKSFVSNPIAFYMDGAKGFADGIVKSSAIRRIFPSLLPGEGIDFSKILAEKWLKPDASFDGMFGSVIDDIGDSWPKHKVPHPESPRLTSRLMARGKKFLTKAQEVALIGLEGFEEVLNHAAAHIADGVFQREFKKKAKLFPNGTYNVDDLVDGLSPLHVSDSLKAYWKELGQRNPRALRNEYAKWFVEEVFVGRTKFNRVAAFSGLRMSSDVLSSALTQRALLFTRHPGMRLGQLMRMMKNGYLKPDEAAAAAVSMAIGGAVSYNLLKAVHPGEDTGQFVDTEALSSALSELMDDLSHASEHINDGVFKREINKDLSAAKESFSPAARRTAAYSIMGAPYDVYERLFGPSYDADMTDRLMQATPGLGIIHSLKRAGEKYEKGEKLLGAVLKPPRKYKKILVPDEPKSHRASRSSSRKRRKRKRSRR